MVSIMACENCGNFHDGTYGSGRFCCKSCARSFSTKGKRDIINKKISKSLKGSGNDDVELTCKYCDNTFIVKWKYRHQEFCSRSCSMSWKNESMDLARKAGLKSSVIQYRRSKNEKLFARKCKEYFNDVLTNEPIFNGWDADVIIEDIKVAILWNGKWHYEKITEDHSLKQVQNRDKIKLKEIKKSGYKPYIIKDMGSSNPEFVD